MILPSWNTILAKHLVTRQNQISKQSNQRMWSPIPCIPDSPRPCPFGTDYSRGDTFPGKVLGTVVVWSSSRPPILFAKYHPAGDATNAAKKQLTLGTVGGDGGVGLATLCTHIKKEDNARLSWRRRGGMRSGTCLILAPPHQIRCCCCWGFFYLSMWWLIRHRMRDYIWEENLRGDGE